MQHGICSNYPDRCENAKNQTPVPFTGSGNCPICGKALQPSAAGAVAHRPITWGIVAVAALVVLGAVFFGIRYLPGWMQQHTKSDGAAVKPPDIPPPVATKAETLLRLSGSTTIGDRGAPLLVRGWLVSIMGVDEASLQTHPLVESIESGEKQRVGEIVSGTVGGKAVEVIIRRRGSKFGFVDLKSDQADVAMASREINATELAAARDAGLGDMKSRFSETVIGLDGIAIIVARDNPVAVKSLSVQQVHDIFTGRIRDWSEIGAPSGKIELYIRTPGSGTYDTFRDLVLGPDAVAEPRHVVEDSEEIDTRVGTDRNAIGFVSSGLVSESSAVPVGQAGYRPLKPSMTTIKTENYLLRRRLYLYRREAEPRSREASLFVSYAKSEEGQQRMRDAHLVDLIPLPVDDVPDNVDARREARQGCMLSGKYERIYHRSVDSLCDLRTRYRQLQTSFYFALGSFELDYLGLDQIDRVTRQIQIQSAKKPRDVVLAGFADTRGDYLYNCKLALDRAVKVASYLSQQGITVGKNVSFCSEAPLVDSSSDEGLRQNRRVEVYIDNY